MKNASRERDESKIMSYGPYALCLSYILAKANQPEKTNFDEMFVFPRNLLIFLSVLKSDSFSFQIIKKCSKNYFQNFLFSNSI